MLRQALVDEELVEEEIALLTTMRQAFGIDDQTHERLLAEARADPVLDQQQ